MNNKFLVFFVILIVYDQTSGYSSEDNVKGSTNFSFDLYRALFNQQDNLVLSPYSFRILLGILYQSSYETSQSQIHDKVYFGEKLSTLATQKSAIDHFTLSPYVKVANKLYVREGVTIKPDFKTVLEQYQSDIELVNFSEAAKVAKNMNQWIEEKTNGLIKNLVNEAMLTPNKALFIINTLYFKAKWEHQISRNLRKITFHGYDENYEIDFMSNTASYRMTKYDELKVEVIEMPYTTDSNFVFWIIIPSKASNLQELQSNLNYDFIQKLNENMYSNRIQLFMPVYELESQIDGKEALKKLGITNIFTEGQLNILELHDEENLVVDDVRQKTKIKVDTEGTEASSATYFAAMPARPGPPTPSLYVDRPFMYMIMTADTKEPVFVGHFVKQ